LLGVPLQDTARIKNRGGKKKKVMVLPEWGGSDRRERPGGVSFNRY